MGRYKKKNKQQSSKNADEGVSNKEGVDAKKCASRGKDGKDLMGYTKVVSMENPAFEEYYKAQNICENEEEWAEFMAFCRQGLPCGLRVNGTLGKQAELLWKQFSSLFALPKKAEWEAENGSPGAHGRSVVDNIKTIEKTDNSSKEETSDNRDEKSDGKVAIAAADDSGVKTPSEKTPAYMLRPEQLSFYPRDLAFQFDYLDARSIKKDENFRWLKNFLMSHEIFGALQRQETVSMIPPFFLDIQPDDLVLDLCAAPGSKTCQMLEKLHWESCKPEDKGPCEFTLAKGGVLANDVEWKRANMLTHQVQRIGSPGVGVLNTDAQFFPGMKRADGSALEFDKVLCDVPCSGDGTIRKTPNIWKTWTTADGMGLHFRQLTILHRGLDVLKIGGRLVYSTCSLNPMENESVVSAALEKYGDSIELVAPPEGLNAKPGLTTWKVPVPKTAEFLSSWEETPANLKETGKIKATMFPPATPHPQLVNVRRFLPHLMNTGGFFVAIFEKKAPLPKQVCRHKKQADYNSKENETKNGSQKKTAAETEECAAPAEDSTTSPPVKKAKTDPAIHAEMSPSNELSKKQPSQKLSNHPKAADESDIFERLAPETNQEWRNIAEWYGLPDTCASYFFRRPKVHGMDKIYGISEKLQDAVQCCQNTGSTKVIACGVRTFQELQNFGGKCGWRLTQQGVGFVKALGMNKNKIINVNKEFLTVLLDKRVVDTADVIRNKSKYLSDEEFNKFAKITGEDPGVAADEGKTEEEKKKETNWFWVEQGCYVFEEASTGISIVALMSRNSITLYVDKQQANALLECSKVGLDLPKEMGF